MLPESTKIGKFLRQTYGCIRKQVSSLVLWVYVERSLHFQVRFRSEWVTSVPELALSGVLIHPIRRVRSRFNDSISFVTWLNLLKFPVEWRANCTECAIFQIMTVLFFGKGENCEEEKLICVTFEHSEPRWRIKPCPDTAVAETNLGKWWDVFWTLNRSI